MKNLAFKYPSFTHLIGVLAEAHREEYLSKSLIRGNSWYKVPTEEYRRLVVDWTGEPLDIVKAHDYYEWMGMKHYYVFTTESRRILAKIQHDGDYINYYLSLNA